jgi:diguanylate cyclase (GGDEF)-like protein
MPNDEESDRTAIASHAEVTERRLAQRAKQQRPWIVIVSGAANVGKMFRLDGEMVVGRSPSATLRIEEDGVSRSHAKIVLLANGGAQVVDLESRNGTYVNGERVKVAPLSDGDKIQVGTTTILKFSYQDALDEELQQNLYASATRDPLTQLANKRTFSEMLDRELAYAARHGGRLSLVTFDVDHFKRINDGYGHPAGDHVLRKLAELVSAGIRTEDVAARVGGEEFAVILREVPLAGAVDCAERLRRSVEAAVFEHEKRRIAVTVSLGVATLSKAERGSADALVKAADACLYQAKQGGRNRVCSAEMK